MSVNIAKDIHLYIWDPNAGPAAYVEVTGLQTLNNPPLPKYGFEQIDGLDESDRAARFLPLLFDSGVLSFTYLHDSADTGQGVLATAAMLNTNALQQFKLDWRGVIGGLEFFGYLQDFNFPAGKNEHVKPSFSIKFDGPLTDTVPSVLSVAVDTASPYPAYVTSNKIVIYVTFSEVVYVASGTPGVTLNINLTGREAAYVSGSGTNKLKYEYTVQVGDSATAGQFSIASPLVLNGATIRDIVAQNASPLTFSPPTGQTDLITVN